MEYFKTEGLEFNSMMLKFSYNYLNDADFK